MGGKGHFHLKKNIFDTRKEDKSPIWGHNIDRKGTSLFDPNLLKFLTYISRVELNPCIGARLVQPDAANYNDLSVPDPATACGNRLYSQPGQGER